MARNRAELYYHELFQDLAARYPNFSYVPALSEPEAEDASGRRDRFCVTRSPRAHFDNDFRGHKVYHAGPPVMIDACITTLMQGRLFERDIWHGV